MPKNQQDCVGYNWYRSSGGESGGGSDRARYIEFCLAATQRRVRGGGEKWPLVLFGCLYRDLRCTCCPRWGIAFRSSKQTRVCASLFTLSFLLRPDISANYNSVVNNLQTVFPLAARNVSCEQCWGCAVCVVASLAEVREWTRASQWNCFVARILLLPSCYSPSPSPA